MLKQLWNDDAGFIVSTELLLIFVILVLGLIAGLTNLRTAVVIELTESAQAILALNQGYNINGVSGCNGFSNGSSATDVNGSVGLSSAGGSGGSFGNVTQQISQLCP
jgi:hypothetical protein